MKLNFVKLDKRFLRELPFLFEKYEIFIILFGIVVAFLLAGFILYENAYKTTTTIPDVTVDVTRINSNLFEKTVRELEQRKQLTPDLPIIDPFQ